MEKKYATKQDIIDTLEYVEKMEWKPIYTISKENFYENKQYTITYLKELLDVR